MALKRLDKLLADMGIASRSELKQIIKSGRVSVDGRAVTFALSCSISASRSASNAA